MRHCSCWSVRPQTAHRARGCATARRFAARDESWCPNPARAGMCGRPRAARQPVTKHYLLSPCRHAVRHARQRQTDTLLHGNRLPRCQGTNSVNYASMFQECQPAVERRDRACDTGVNTDPCISLVIELATRQPPEASSARAQARMLTSVTVPLSASTARFRYRGTARPGAQARVVNLTATSVVLRSADTWTDSTQLAWRFN
jgi:hypothetical protein